MLIVFGVTTFLGVAGFANFCMQRKWHLSYESDGEAFGLLYMVAISLVVFLTGNQITMHWSATDTFILCCTCFVYILFGVFWNVRQHVVIDPSYFQVPPGSQISFVFTGGGQLVKILEICLQQLCAFMIVLGLYQSGLNLLALSLVFALIVYLVHLPGRMLFGPVFGEFFLWSATGIAVICPYVFLYLGYGLSIMFAIHVLVYALWFSFLVWYANQAYAK